MLNDILEQKKCFKLVCGCGNEDAQEVKKLVALYSKAGCNFFDVCAKPEVLLAAKRGLEFAGIKKDRYLCVSVGIDGDPHTNKAVIDETLCNGCGFCLEGCPQSAISKAKNNSSEILQKRCIGCGHCISLCKRKAISLKSIPQNIEEILPPLIDIGIDCIEFHIITENEKEVDEKWDYLNRIYDGFLCISIDRSKLGDEKLLERVKRMLKKRKPYTTIIQADGIAMSGSNNDYRTTLQSVAITEFFESKNLPVYIMSSGGTNLKTIELSKMCGLSQNALAVGSYARKIVKEYISREDFLENSEIFQKALNIAKNLVESSLEKMG